MYDSLGHIHWTKLSKESKRYERLSINSIETFPLSEFMELLHLIWRKNMFYRILVVILFLMTTLSVSNCNRLKSIDYSPPVTPSEFLTNQDWIKISFGEFSFILSQPSSSFFVYLLSIFYIYAGWLFWRNFEKQNSRYYWAIGFYLTGIAAILAGTSYQALGYELKCSLRESCQWTTWWEVNYEILQNAGMNGFLAAAAYTNAKGLIRKIILIYAVLNTVIYTGLVVFGAIVPIQFLISFEFLELSCLPALIFFLISSGFAYFKNKDKMNFHLFVTWFMLALVMVAYVISLEMNLTSLLWAQGIWFTENDVLHVGLIFWVAYIIKFLPKYIFDKAKN